MMVVRFVTGCAPYNAGEVAGFPEAEARRLIAAGVAVEYAPEHSAWNDKAPAGPPADKMVWTAARKSPRRK